MNSSGKGDRPRSVDKHKYDNNYKKIFGKKDYGRLGERFAKELAEGYQGYQGYQGGKSSKIFKKTY